MATRRIQKTVDLQFYKKKRKPVKEKPISLQDYVISIYLKKHEKTN